MSPVDVVQSTSAHLQSPPFAAEPSVFVQRFLASRQMQYSKIIDLPEQLFVDEVSVLKNRVPEDTRHP